MAIDASVAVQDVEYDILRRRLLADGQVLEYTGPPRLRRLTAICSERIYFSAHHSAPIMERGAADDRDEASPHVSEL